MNAEYRAKLIKKQLRVYDQQWVNVLTETLQASVLGIIPPLN